MSCLASYNNGHPSHGPHGLVVDPTRICPSVLPGCVDNQCTPKAGIVACTDYDGKGDCQTYYELSNIPVSGSGARRSFQLHKDAKFTNIAVADGSYVTWDADKLEQRGICSERSMTLLGVIKGCSVLH